MSTLYMSAAAKAGTTTTNGDNALEEWNDDAAALFSYDATNYGQGPMTPALVPFGGSAPRVLKPDKELLGGKGMGLQEMASIGIAVPPGFTLTTPLCQLYQSTGDVPAPVWDEVRRALRRIERDVGRSFGDPTNPLLLSCRSGAAVSMPGMMDTVLNIGLNEETVKGLAKATKDRRFAYDSYRRLLDMFGDVVLGIDHEHFEAQLDSLKKEAGVQSDVELDADQLERLCQLYLHVYEAHHLAFPRDPFEQVRACVKAVFGSWNADRAVTYREIHNIKSLMGTACNVQAMVFGNLGRASGTGVAFSRDPGTGENVIRGEYLINAQGEDVVAGIRTPEPIATMKHAMPGAYDEFVKHVHKLERHFKDMQDVEFTVESGRLWMLQCRSGKRTGHAAFKIAVDMVEEGLCTIDEALQRVEPDHVKQVLHPTFSAEALASARYKDNVVAVGLAGGPGAAVGKIVFDTKRAEERTAEGVILVRRNTSPEDVGGMWASKGILTSQGGVTSHAAVVARGWGKPCVVGCDAIEIDEVAGTMTIKSTGKVFKEGDSISINGSSGEVISVPIATTTPTLSGNFGTLLGWADSVPDSLTVMANADSGPDAAKAQELGAKGIGLCRTEHMFFAPQDRLPVVRRWILRGEGLERVREFQHSDFKEILRVMDGMPVTIRLLDPPLHEFLPRAAEVTASFAKSLGYGDKETLMKDIDALHEENPMLGLRGCRLGIVHNELSVMQVEAIMSAACDLVEERSEAQPFPRIMIPLIGSVREFEQQALLIKRTAERVQTDRGIKVRYEIGTMIEVPRAALVADKIASVADPDAAGGSHGESKPLCSFFSFGTNDLTQMTMGISRDDAGEFIPKYRELHIFDEDPFKSIDVEGVGWLVQLAAAKGRSVNSHLSLSVCGEHGGDPASIHFFDDVGLDYVSCSPYRVPVARLACGQAALRREGGRPQFVTKEDRVLQHMPLQ